MTDTWSVTGATREQRQAIADSLDDTRSWVDPRGYRLSDRLWLGRDADRKAIDKVLRQCLAAGLNPLETERVLTKYLTPGGMAGGIGQATTQDGQSRYPIGSRFDQDTQQWVDNLSRRGNYAARRLARTEQARAYGAATLEAAARNPWTAGVQWNLTGRHAEEDECDENAHANPDGLGRGVYKVENFPRFPNHPNCLCYVTKVAKPLDDVLAIAREELAGGGGAGAALAAAVVQAATDSGEQVSITTQSNGAYKSPIERLNELVTQTVIIKPEFGAPGDEMMTRIANHLESRLGQFPQFFPSKKLQALVFAPDKKGLASIQWGTHIMSFHVKLEEVNANWELDRKFMAEHQGKPWTTTAYFPQSSNLENTIDHELGHMIYSKHFDRSTRTLVGKAINGALRNGWELPSRYAEETGVNDNEGWAEVFALYVNNRHDLLTPGIVEAIDDALAKKPSNKPMYSRRRIL